MPQAETPAALERKNMKNIRVNRIGRKEELPTRWGRLSAAFDPMIGPGSWPVRAIQNVVCTTFCTGIIILHCTRVWVNKTGKLYVDHENKICHFC